MAFKKRKDGIYLKKLPAFRRIFPYLMQTRTESLVYFNQKIEIAHTKQFLKKINAGKSPDEKISLFHVFLTAAARTLKMRPELNRFIVGRRIYEHKDISVSFIVKKKLTDEAEETNAHIVFSGTETLAEIKNKTNTHLEIARGEQKGDDDKLIEFVAAFPRPVINIIGWLIRTLDYHNMLPNFLMNAIPLYTSVFITNLGSIWLNAPFHHLYEYGSASMFLAIGKIHKEVVADRKNNITVKNCIDISLTLDERITEGFYCVKSIILFTQLIKYPELLEKGELSVDKILAYRPQKAKE
jgi:pyruvate/2-oxoglutarate dehydrogenase complex dihydrolipoamide acyltransferase (E2) component